MNKLFLAGPKAEQPVVMSVLSGRSADPPIFVLAFNVTNAPPTYVACTVDGGNIDMEQLSRYIVNGPGSVTGVEVTLGTRSAGAYECTVSNDRVDDTTAFNSSVQIDMTGKI